jgi:hypothetical protein
MTMHPTPAQRAVMDPLLDGRRHDLSRANVQAVMAARRRRWIALVEGTSWRFEITDAGRAALARKEATV